MSILSELGVRHGKNRGSEIFLYNLACCYMHAERVLEKILASSGLSPVKLNALMIIKHLGCDKWLSQKEIARRMIVSAGSITRLLDRLEKNDLIFRSPSASDRRVNLIRVTSKASQLLDRVWPVYKKKVDEIVSWVPRSALRPTTSALHEFRRKISQIAQEGTP